LSVMGTPLRSQLHLKSRAYVVRACSATQSNHLMQEAAQKQGTPESLAMPKVSIPAVQKPNEAQ